MFKLSVYKSAKARPAFSFWVWGDLRHFLPRTPSLSGSSTQFNGIFAQMFRWGELGQQQHSRPDRDPVRDWKKACQQTLALVMRNKKCHYRHMAKCTIQHQPRGKILPPCAFLLFRSHSQQHRQSQARKNKDKDSSARNTTNMIHTHCIFLWRHFVMSCVN